MEYATSFVVPMRDAITINDHRIKTQMVSLNEYRKENATYGCLH